PQSRRRVLIVAVREGPAPRPPGPGATPAIRAAFERLPADLKRRWIDWPPAPAVGRNADLADLLEPDDAVRWHPEETTDRLVAQLDARNRAKLDEALAAGGRQVGAVFRRIRGGEQRAEVRFDGLAGCLRTPRGGSSRQILLVVEEGSVRSRLLAPREAARLMGLPEDYRLPPTATGAFMVTGDGVAVPVVRWLAQAILEPLLSPGARVMAAE
ncbi:MAG TPA: DNA cytosine methyltransferase, partial [Caulobacteraceae bacterium]|nr:DNA cytosine methyltransferase [Caulobacteraceae bacterium]